MGVGVEYAEVVKGAVADTQYVSGSQDKIDQLPLAWPRF